MFSYTYHFPFPLYLRILKMFLLPPLISRKGAIMSSKKAIGHNQIRLKAKILGKISLDIESSETYEP